MIRSVGLGALIAACLFSPWALADNQNVQITLSQIEKLKASEEGGDELYFSVTEYSSIERPKQTTVPSFPTHWLSKHLENVEDVVLWEKDIQDQESVMLVISLIERDAPPWNVDDLIGSVKFKIKNDHGNLKKAWVIPNRKDTKRLDPKKNVFELTGDEADYKIELEVHTQAEVIPASAR